MLATTGHPFFEKKEPSKITPRGALFEWLVSARKVTSRFNRNFPFKSLEIEHSTKNPTLSAGTAVTSLTFGRMSERSRLAQSQKGCVVTWDSGGPGYAAVSFHWPSAAIAAIGEG